MLSCQEWDLHRGHAWHYEFGAADCSCHDLLARYSVLPAPISRGDMTGTHGTIVAPRIRGWRLLLQVLCRVRDKWDMTALTDTNRAGARRSGRSNRSGS
jgi:hypothetical protein